MYAHFSGGNGKHGRNKTAANEAENDRLAKRQPKSERPKRYRPVNLAGWHIEQARQYDSSQRRQSSANPDPPRPPNLPGGQKHRSRQRASIARRSPQQTSSRIAFWP